MAKRKHISRPAEKLFADDQMDMFEKSYEEQLKKDKNRLVECLGMTFENEEKRREYFLEKLRKKIKDPEFRKIEGFPIGEDGDILALSDPPYYTACPNPFVDDFIKHYGKPYDLSTDAYRREPFAADVSEGKNDPIYNARSYHTKVPHKAIMRYILHYTEPGDVVFDGFCGTGMTGVAAQMCGNKAVVESLGYQVKSDGTILRQETDENGKSVWVVFSGYQLKPGHFVKTIANGWSRDVLSFQIETQIYKRLGKATNNFKLALPPADSDMASQIFKDPYVFDFLGTANTGYTKLIGVAE